MIAVICFLWRAANQPRRYHARHVNALRAMLTKHMSAQHKLICVTDDAAGFDPGIEHRPVDKRLVSLQRYAKLEVFRPDAASYFGADRLLLLDLDCLIVGDPAPLAQRVEDFVIWRDTQAGRSPIYRYNSSIVSLRAGSKPQLWTGFDATATPAKVRQSGLCGSDQAYIGMTLGTGAATFTKADGVLSFKRDLDQRADKLPHNARIVFFAGRPKAWEIPPEHALRQRYETFCDKAAA